MAHRVLPVPNDVLGNPTVAVGTQSTPVPDLPGSIIGVMDAGSGSLAAFSYRPYGASAATPGQFGDTSQRVDVRDGPYDHRARHCSPVWGRFLQADPAGYSDGFTLYAHASNSPPSGRRAG
jgi:RHS repeat-associated protein